MTHDQAVAQVRAFWGRMAIVDPRRESVNDALVRNDPREIMALALANPAPPTPRVEREDLADVLDRYDPREGAWLRAARVRLREQLERDVKQPQKAQERRDEQPAQQRLLADEED